MSYAQVKDGVVWNCILATDEWVAENEGVDGFTYVKYVDEDGHPIFRPYPGCRWDEVNQGFIPPEEDPDNPPPAPIMEVPPDNAEIEEALGDILGF